MPLPREFTASPQHDAEKLGLRFTESQRQWLHHHVRNGLVLMHGPQPHLCSERLVAMLDAVDAHTERNTEDDGQQARPPC